MRYERGSSGPAANAFIAALPAYNAGRSAAQARHVHPVGPLAALASNENPFGFSPMVTQAARVNARDRGRAGGPG